MLDAAFLALDTALLISDDIMHLIEPNPLLVTVKIAFMSLEKTDLIVVSPFLTAAETAFISDDTVALIELKPLFTFA